MATNRKANYRNSGRLLSVETLDNVGETKMARHYKKLNRSNIRKTKPGDAIREHGICFERLRNGDGRYSVNIMVDGQRIHRVIGYETDRTTRSQAEQFIEQVRSDAKHSRLNLPKGRKTAISFRDASKKYIQRLENSGGKDISAKKRKLEMHLVPFFKDRPLDKISGFDANRYVKKRGGEKAIKSFGAKKKATYKETSVTPATINRELAVLSHLLNKAVEWNWIESRPCKIERLKENNTRIVYLTTDQTACLLEYAKRDKCAQIYPFIIIGLSTSMRLAEILEIRTKNVNTFTNNIIIPKAKAGNRIQPMTKELGKYLRDYIEDLPDDCEWLFPSSRSRTGHTVNINKPFRRVVKAAGLDPEQVVRHTLRHTAITHLVQAGADFPTVQRISGHKTPSMVVRYAHTNGDQISAAMDLLEGRITPIQKVG